MTTMAAKYISQGTFDDVVKENVVDFSMNVDEAKQETIKQFEAQGISLSNIIKDLSLNEETGAPLLNEAIASIKRQIGENTINPVELIECLSILDTECQKSIPHRVLASKNGAQDALITLLEQEFCAETKDASTANVGLLEWSLRAVNSLTNKQPDIFGAEALAVVIKLLDRYSREETVVCLTLQWLQKACIMHETNRQNIMSSTILKQLKPLLALKVDNVVREVMTVLRYLVLDDDIRVEFGCAHEHARIIASAFILDLTKLLGELQDINLLADLMLTIGTLAVRQELCTVIEDAGGLRLVLQIMLANPNSVRVNREALKLLRALAGNDTVKAHIVQQGAAPIITELLQTHMSNENVATAALACVSTITLRVKENSTAFFQSGIAEPLVETMRLHAGSNTVQRNGAWAIRNMVSRSREQCETWLSYGLEDLLNAAMVEHISVQQDIRAALRDLGCKVVLREEWTGTAEKKIAI